MELYIYNVKLRWNLDKYRLLDYGAERDVPLTWVEQQEEAKEEEEQLKKQEAKTRGRAMHHTNPVKITLRESLKYQIEMYDAWVDFKVRRKEGDHKSTGLRFALIRLRIRRKSKDFLTNVILPFIVIVSTSFSIFSIPPDDPADRLGVSVTILLTFTAFQSIVGDGLPQTSEVAICTYYLSNLYN